METAALLHGAASTTEHRVQVFVLGAPGIGRVRSTAGVSMVFDAGEDSARVEPTVQILP